MRPSIATPCFLLMACQPYPAPPPLPDGRDTILVVVDALRADFIQRPELPTPNLDRLVARSTLYERAFTHGVETITAMPALLCGLDSQHGWMGERFPGHARVFFNSNAWIGPPLTNGFETVEFINYRYLDDDRVDGLQLGERFITWLGQHPEPVLAVLHYMDVHAPYQAPGGPAGRVPLTVNGPVPTTATLDDLTFTRQRYGDGVVYLDSLLGPVLNALEARPHPTFLVLTADHGESLGNWGQLGHGGDVLPDTVRVPLVVFDSTLPAGRSQQVVSHQDVLFWMLGQEPPPREILVQPGATVRWPWLHTAQLDWNMESGLQTCCTALELDFSAFPVYTPPEDRSGRMRALGYLN